MWDLRTRKLLRSVPLLDGTSITFSSGRGSHRGKGGGRCRGRGRGQGEEGGGQGQRQKGVQLATLGGFNCVYMRAFAKPLYAASITLS